VGVIIGTCLQLVLAVFFVLDYGKKYFGSINKVNNKLNTLVVCVILVSITLFIWIIACSILQNYLSTQLYYIIMYTSLLCMAIGLVLYNHSNIIEILKKLNLAAKL
jgi:hypothetical protein